MAFGYRGAVEYLRPHPVAGHGDGLTFGCAMLPGPHHQPLTVIFSSGDAADHGWEHVSVSTPRRTPNWAEMCYVKELFWDAEDTVLQFHPPKSQYVNDHPHCLHLWRPTTHAIPLPPLILL